MASSFTINLADLTKILFQIEIAEQNAGNQDLNPGAVNVAGVDLVTLIGQDAALLPVGLRTVSGIYNHLLPGQELVGASDQPFPRLLTQELRTGTPSGVDFSGDGIADFFGAPGNAGAVYNPAGSVVDSQPRTISNLVVDQSINNPAAVEAWFANPLTLEAFTLAHPGMTPVRPGEVTNPLTELEVSNTDLSVIPNQSPDIGLSPQFNGFMTFFGQFFDHGLDLVPKGGNGTVYIPLQPDDPLYVEGSPTNFMVISRIQPNAINITTPFVDQNQTYTSHASHQVFLREYVMDAGEPIATGRLLSGTDGGLPKWADVKAQAHVMLGIQLVDADVLRVPLLATDEYGRFIRGSHGFVQIVTATGLVEANPADNGGLGTLIPANVIPSGTAFLDDIAHNAVPKAGLLADADDFVGQSLGPQDPGTYDNELLDQHFITGDGRGNENIGLTTVHTVFHNEHDRLVEANKVTILASGDLAVINQWLDPDHQLLTLPAPGDALIWNGERLFQAARFVTEMQYQHLVFEEFARKLQPNVDPFVFTNSADLNPAIIAEFAHTVFRFGHSMLLDTVDRLDNDLSLVGDTTEQIGLIQAFLNPVAFSTNSNGSNGTLTAADITAQGVDAGVAAGAVLRGMTRQAGNEIDEFVVNALRNNLVGLPLDLPAINMARGRDAGIPTFNHARAELYAMTGDAQLKPYVSWFDFAQNIKHPESIINFIAAYGTHDLITAETTLAGKRAAAMAIVFGTPQDVPENLDMVPPVLAHTITPPSAADAKAFLNATGVYATDGGLETGLNNVDLWIGGLAEELMEFGGMLGSTFGAVFEYQLEHLQNGDRFYYLSRTQGMNFLNQLEPTTFSDLIMRNTDLGADNSTHISGLAFQTPDLILELDPNIAQDNVGLGAADPTWDNAFRQAFDPKVTRDNPNTLADESLTHTYLKFSGGEHVVLGGTEGNDTLLGDKGIDTLWGDGGDDYLNAGMESDQVFGGAGDDIIEDPFGDNFLRGGQGNDVISSGHGLSILFGEQGNDFIMASTDTVEVFAGEGDDFLLGGSAADVLMGNEGDDWIEGGEGFDGLSGENSELFFNSPIVGHDILNGQGNDTDYDGENGDDIMVQSSGIQRNNGMDGFDWAIHKGDANGADSDLGIRVFDARQALILRDRFDSVEGLSGWQNDDILTGALKPLLGENFTDALTQAGLDRIAGLREVVGAAPGAPDEVVFESDVNIGGEIILGGGGNDTITGNLGDDILDGDAWLNVRIEVHSTVVDPVTGLFGPGDSVMFSVDSLSEIRARMLSRGPDHINPGQLKAVREILYDDLTDGSNPADGNTDIAVFTGLLSDYIITNNEENLALNPNKILNIVDNRGIDSSPVGDTLRNMEILRFSDQDLLVSTFFNTPATGAPIITDLTPTEGQVLSLNTASIFDAEGLGPFTFQWQSSPNGLDTWTDIALATSATFTPQDLPLAAFGAQAGLQLRAVVSFTDGGGHFESVTSAATGPVGVNWNGVPILAQTFNGTAGDDIANGTILNDTLNGNAGDDFLSGGALNDTITGGAGNDTIIGGTQLLGSDAAVFTGAVINYTVDTNVTNNIVVTDNVGTEGTDTLTGIEQLRFNGINYAVVTGGLGNDTSLNGVNGAAGSQAIFGLSGNDSINGGAGNDLINGGLGTDTIIQAAGTGGRDLVNGGANVDTYQLNGDATAENFQVYSRTAALANIVGLTLNLNTEIVIVRNGVVIAELDNIEEIVINTGLGADTVTPIGDFTPTNLNFNTITINGGEGDDTVDVTQLTSEHHVVLNTGGGTDNFIGQRPQDEMNITSPQNENDDDDEDDDNDDDEDDDNDDDNDNDDDGEGQSTGGTGNSALPFVVYLGTGADDTSIGGAGHDTLAGEGGDDTLFGLDGNDNLAGGAGADQLIGGAGDDILIGNGDNDTILAGAGNDTVLAGSGDDTVFGDEGNDLIFANEGRDVINGGAGNDTIFASIGDGADAIHGGEGSDTLDLEAITASLVVDLGSSGIGSSASTQSGIDTLSGIENVKGGSGNDTIIASNSVNVLDGGGGDDTFVFKTAAAANGDTIEGFQPGDMIDLSPLYASLNLGIPSSDFAIVANFTAAGQLKLHVVGEDTIIEGNTDNDNSDVDFSIKIAGRTNLTSGDFA